MVPRSQVKTCNELGSRYNVEKVVDARNYIAILNRDSV
jgi:hypothetical protein